MTSNDALISVIIPSYNYGHFVTAAVESALAQTYQNVEVIVVDDGSKDDTRQRLAPYLDRIRYLYQENQGLGAARNTGIRAAAGDFIALLDSDDVWHPRKLELQMGYLSQHPEIGLLGAQAVYDLSPDWPALPSSAELAALRITLDELIIRGRFGPSGVVVRRHCLDKVGWFDTAAWGTEDRDMWLRIAAEYRIACLQAPLWYYRIHGQSMSNVAARMEANELKVLRKAFAALPGLQGRPFLRLKVLSYAAFSAAYMYNTVGLHLPALRRMLKSFLLWPFPYRRSEVNMALARPKLLGMTVLRLLRLVPALTNQSPSAGQVPRQVTSAA